VKPELKRRMKKGIWYFPIPTEEEKTVIVEIFKKKFPEVDASDWANVNSKDWTGFEVETCFQTADEEGCSLSEAARSIIPVAVSGKEQVEALNRDAHGRYNSVSYPGAFDKNQDILEEQFRQRDRKIAQEDE
jgi:hypothetical protein